MHPAWPLSRRSKMRAGRPTVSKKKQRKRVCMQGAKFEVLKKSAQNFGSFAETTDLARETTDLQRPRSMVLAVLAETTDLAREHC